MVDLFAEFDDTEEDKAQQVIRLLGTRGTRSKFTPTYLHSILHELAHTSDGELFKDISLLKFVRQKVSY